MLSQVRLIQSEDAFANCFVGGTLGQTKEPSLTKIIFFKKNKEKNHTNETKLPYN